MWINEFTDRMVKENVERLKKAGIEEVGEVLELLYEEIKRLNLIINEGETPYSTAKTVDEETRAQLSR